MVGASSVLGLGLWLGLGLELGLGVGVGVGRSRVRDSHLVSLRLVGAAACGVRRPVVITPAACGVRRAAAERAREGRGHLGSVRARVRDRVGLDLALGLGLRSGLLTSRHTCFYP